MMGKCFFTYGSAFLPKDVVGSVAGVTIPRGLNSIPAEGKGSGHSSFANQRLLALSSNNCLISYHWMYFNVSSSNANTKVQNQH